MKLTIFVVDITHRPAIREARNEHIDTARPPASSIVEVRRLFRDDVLLEIEAIAVVAD